MSYLRYFQPGFEMPFHGETAEAICQEANDYFSGLLDEFLVRLPEYRRPFDLDDWLADEPTLSEKIDLIFPKGFGEYDENRNHNPQFWPSLVELSRAVEADTLNAFIPELCTAWHELLGNEYGAENSTGQVRTIFGYLTGFVHHFIAFSDPGSVDLEFKFPPDYVRDNLVPAP